MNRLLFLFVAIIVINSCKVDRSITEEKTDSFLIDLLSDTAGLYMFPGGYIGGGFFTNIPSSQDVLPYHEQHMKYKKMTKDSLTFEYDYIWHGRNYIYEPDTLKFLIDYRNKDNSIWINKYTVKIEGTNEYYYKQETVDLTFIDSINIYNYKQVFTIYSFKAKDEFSCYNYYFNKEIGLVKRYTNDEESSFEIDTSPSLPNRSNLIKLMLLTIKENDSFHKKCSKGKRWVYKSIID
jgi:hypothetical protein